MFHFVSLIIYPNHLTGIRVIPLLAIMKNVTVNNGAHISLCVFASISLGQVPGNRIAGSKG